MKAKLYLIFIFYILIALTLYLTFKLKDFIQNNILIALISPLPLLILFYLFLDNKKTTPPSPKKQTIRYTMHCKNCNWEWMSHTSEKTPSQCPNCKERNRLDVIGWRKVSLPKRKQEQDLKKFI